MSRRLMIAKRGGNVIPADTPFVRVDVANTLLCSIDGREYRKAYDGEAWAALIFIAEGYTCPCLIARTAEACVRDPLITEPPTHIIVSGENWYWCGMEHAMPGEWGSDKWERIENNDHGLAYIAPAGKTSFVTFNNMEAAATALVRILLGIDQAEVSYQNQ